MGNKFKLILMNFLQFAVWGAYLTSQGKYLYDSGFADKIGWFYSVQGIVSIFMPAIIGIIADKWIQAQKLLGISHAIAGIAMIAAGYYGMTSAGSTSLPLLFTLYTISVMFYMPTIALSNSVAYNILEKWGLDPVEHFPPIRIWGTVGFIASMWFVDLMDFEVSSVQYIVSGLLGLVLAIYSFFLPECPIIKSNEKKSLSEAMGLKAFALFKDKNMAIFFIFSMLLGIALQITNGFASPFLTDFGNLPEYADSFWTKHSIILISLSQMSETLCILLIPFFMKRFGIKKVMLLSMIAWVLRFGLFGIGDLGSGLVWIILSMIVYGVAFDFYNVSASLYVNKTTDKSIRSSAQGLFMLMTNGLGASIGAMLAQSVVNIFVNSRKAEGAQMVMDGWQTSWFIFAGYALVVAILFAILFRPGNSSEKQAKD